MSEARLRHLEYVTIIAGAETYSHCLAGGFRKKSYRTINEQAVDPSRMETAESKFRRIVKGEIGCAYMFRRLVCTNAGVHVRIEDGVTAAPVATR